MAELFVYGTLLKGEPRDFLLRSARLVSPRVVSVGLFRMATEGPFPLIWRAERDETHAGRLLGELYELPDHLFRRLDEIESEGYLYSRTRIRLQDVPEDPHTYLTRMEWKERFLDHDQLWVRPNAEGLLSWREFAASV